MSARPVLRTAALLAALAAAPARASEADAFENKVPPISGQLYPKAGRLELTPGVSFSVNDPFYAKTFGSLKLTWHVTEFFSAGLTAAGGLSSPTGSTTICTANQGCAPASEEQLRQVPGKIEWMAGAEGAFAPVYGKLNLAAELPVHFDLCVLAGADWITYQKAVDATAAALGPPGSASSIGGHLGLGMRFFFAGFMGLRFEVRDYLYSADVGSEKHLQNQLFLDLGLSFLFPTTPRGGR
jgi:outer membrane beta-barrel protein